LFHSFSHQLFAALHWQSSFHTISCYEVWLFCACRIARKKKLILRAKRRRFASDCTSEYSLAEPITKVVEKILSTDNKVETNR